MMQKVLFDASVYIEAFREGREALSGARTRGPARVYLSAVVGSELLRGSRGSRAQSVTRKLWKDFQKAKRLVVPIASDWHDAGIVLAKIAVKHGYESVCQARLVHDVLIALSARRLGIGVVTLNVADFERIAEFRLVRVLSARDVEGLRSDD